MPLSNGLLSENDIFAEDHPTPSEISTLTAVVLLAMLGGTGEKLDWARETKSRLTTIRGVKEVYGVLGRYDLVAIVEADTLEKLTSLVADEVRSVPGIQSSETLTIIF